MALRECTWSGSGRDEGKKFFLKEMTAFACEEWARNAVSIISRIVNQTDDGINLIITDALRETLTMGKPKTVEVHPKHKDKLNDPNIKAIYDNAKKENEAKARKELDNLLSETPMRLAQTMGVRLFLQLPKKYQDEILYPLLCCASYEKDGKKVPVGYMEFNEFGDAVFKLTEGTEEFIEEASTYTGIQTAAFELHAFFFENAVKLITIFLAKKGMEMEMYQRQSSQVSQEQ